MPEDLSMDLAWPGDVHMRSWLQSVTKAMAESQDAFLSGIGQAQGSIGEETLQLVQLPACKGHFLLTLTTFFPLFPYHFQDWLRRIE